MASDGPIYEKFQVRRTGGSDAPGGRHDGCLYFALDVDHDPFGRESLYAYADVCRGVMPQLSADIFRLLRERPIKAKEAGDGRRSDD